MSRFTKVSPKRRHVLAACAGRSMRPHFSRALKLAFALLLAATGSVRLAAAEGLDGKPYSLAVEKVSAKRGQAATAHVVFRAAPGWHVNGDYPTVLKLSLPAGISAAKSVLKREDAKLSEQEGRFDVVLTASEPGAKTVRGDLSFAVCSQTTCDPQKAAITIEMKVE